MLVVTYEAFARFLAEVQGGLAPTVAENWEILRQEVLREEDEG